MGVEQNEGGIATRTCPMIPMAQLLSSPASEPSQFFQVRFPFYAMSTFVQRPINTGGKIASWIAFIRIVLEEKEFSP
jgi:hypothetical protein